MLRNDIDPNLVIIEDYHEHESEFNGKYNKASLFTLPFIDMSVGTNITTRYLRNVFVDDFGIEHDFVRPLFLLFSVKNQKERFWVDFCKTAVARDVYVTDYYVGTDEDEHLIMFVFRVPEKWAEDYKNFKVGRYSLMSDVYKKKFAQHTFSPSGEKRETRMWGILNKSDALKDAVTKMFIVPTTATAEDVVTLRRDMNNWDEVWDKPQPAEEIFRYKSPLNEENANTITIRSDKASLSS